MYSLVLLNSSSFPDPELFSLKNFLSNTFKRAIISTPISFGEVSELLEKSNVESTLFLILSNKTNNSETKYLTKKLIEQNKFVLVYYALV